mgnify:CR=1 FL=1
MQKNSIIINCDNLTGRIDDDYEENMKCNNKDMDDELWQEILKDLNITDPKVDAPFCIHPCSPYPILNSQI